MPEIPNGVVPRRIQIDIAARERVELLFAEQCAERRIRGCERFREPQAIGVPVNSESRRNRAVLRMRNVHVTRFVAREHAGLNGTLESSERTHAASDSATFWTMERARPSSSTSTPSSGISS